MTGVVLLRPAGGGGTSDITISTINGQLVPTFEDTTRGNKQLSVAAHDVHFAENVLSNLDWLRIGNANDADSGYIAELDGTLVFASAHCENTNANSKDIHLFINGADQGSLGTLGGGANVTFINTTVNIDFSQGDRIRLQAQQGSGGNIQDTVVRLSLKWRA